jgi:hypothetical protein
MTEAEWLELPHPVILLDYLRLKASKRDRKLRLFACALVRVFLWHYLTDERSREAVEVSERYGDGLATEEELVSARRAAQAAVRSLEKSSQLAASTMEERGAAGLAAAVAVRKGADAAQIWAAANQFARGGLGAPAEVRGRVDRQFCGLLRDIFGNPFRPVTVVALWLAWNGGTLVKLAESIYGGRAFDRLPILADALEEVGCTDADVLAHCRGGGLHVRGCWVIDLLLGKE